MAFFHARVVPTERPRRLTLPGTCRMFTALTWTFLLANASSTARLIWILLAFGATSKMYLPSLPRTVLFSETTGRMMVLKASSGIGRLLCGDEVRREGPRQLRDGAFGEDHPG